jgi:hypothetical protein
LFVGAHTTGEREGETMDLKTRRRPAALALALVAGAGAVAGCGDGEDGASGGGGSDGGGDQPRRRGGRSQGRAQLLQHPRFPTTDFRVLAFDGGRLSPSDAAPVADPLKGVR